MEGYGLLMFIIGAPIACGLVGLVAIIDWIRLEIKMKRHEKENKIKNEA